MIGMIISLLSGTKAIRNVRLIKQISIASHGGIGVFLRMKKGTEKLFLTIWYAKIKNVLI